MPDRPDSRRQPSDPAPTEERSWAERVLALIPSGVDASLIEENLRRTPTERLERMQQMLRTLESAKRDGRPETP